MKTQLPMTTKEPAVRRDEEHIVLAFRPRNLTRPAPRRNDLNGEKLNAIGSAATGLKAVSLNGPVPNRQGLNRQELSSSPSNAGITQVRPHAVADDLSRYEQDREAPDDFHHRMLANTAAFALTVALTALGIWLAMSIADMRDTQDCVLMGRRDCAHIASPHL